MKKLKLLFVLMLFISSSVFSQFNITGPNNNGFGATDYAIWGNHNIRSIGIGHKENFWVDGWTTANPPRAALHVNDFYLDDPPSWVFTPGQVFRTDGPSNRDNMWQMFTGNNYDNSTEKARLSVPANTNDLVIEACMGHSNIRFNLVHDRQRAILTDGHGQGHFGVGDDFSDPQHMIHVHTTPIIISQPPPASMIGFTHNLTGASATDGFLVGINSDGVAELRQQEDLPIRIFSNEGLLHEQRMIISHDAEHNFPRIGIGTSVLSEPRTFLHIGQDINTVSSGYRTWMNIGELVVNDQSDNMYFGFSDSISIPGTSDYIINWGARSSDANNNILRFVNTTSNTAVTSGSTQGLEVARMVSNGTLGSMGININENPTQTLDVNGNARIRQVPPGDFDRALVINGDGVLHWRNFESGGPGTSLGGNAQGFVGVGTDNPIAALEVANGDIALTADNSGIILKAKDGDNYFRILVDNNGTLYTEQVNIK